MAPSADKWRTEFEVFLSFRGPDTRNTFTSCLYSDMVEKGIRVFKDDEEIRVGQKISGQLLRALADTQIYIPIFSKGFASSPWCLREVAHMVDCTSKSDGKKEILPIFFDVVPDDVKLKTNLYRDALSKHEKKYGSIEVKRWGDALVEVPTRAGWKLERKGFWMHDEVRDLGRYIVKEENFEDAGERCWVQIDGNTLDIQSCNKEKRAVQALSLGISYELTAEELAYLPMLRFLGGERLNLVGDFKNLLRNLRWFSWCHCPLDFSATNLQLVNLVVLNLSGSKITHNWGGWRQIKMAKKLKILDLMQCYELTKTPDFSEFDKLEKLILARKL